MIGELRFSRIVVALVLGGALLAAPDAPAQSSKAAAESLFQAAKQLMQDKKFAEACPKLVESQRLDPAPGTLLNLARCYEGQGKTASAWAEYKEAAVLAHQLGQKEREDGARDLAKELEPKLSKLNILAAATPGLVVKSDGVEMAAATFGTPLFVDPGEHVIEASAPGYETWTVKIVVGPKADSKTANVPVLVKKPETPGAPTATATAAVTATAAATGPAATATATATAAPSATAESSGTRRTASYALMGVGVAGAAVGAILGGLAASDVGTARSDPSLCPDNVCSPKGRALVNDAGTKALVSSIALPVGIAAAGAGVVLFFLSSPSSPKKGQSAPVHSVAVSPFVGPGGGAVSVQGKF